MSAASMEANVTSLNCSFSLELVPHEPPNPASNIVCLDHAKDLLAEHDDDEQLNGQASEVLGSNWAVGLRPQNDSQGQKLLQF